MPPTPKRILVVDDSPVMHDVAKKFLKSAGYKIFSAWDGEECLSIALELKPDAILLDVILPDSDGKDILRKLKAKPETNNIPVLFTTNTVGLNKDKGYEAFEIDGDVYRAFAKPIHQQKILNVLKKEINRAKSGGELPQKTRIHKTGNND